MLERTEHSNGVVTYQSPLLRAKGVVHAFSTRIGGVSLPPFESLNLGNPAGCEQQDNNPNLVDNYRRLQAAIGAGHMPRAWVTQMHGRQVELLEHEPESEYAETLDAEVRDRFSGQLSADGMVTAEPDVLLTIRVADCAAVLLAADEGNIVAAVHAGWRSVVGNIVGKAVRAMGELGVMPEKITAAIGPCISVEHFEVGPEVAEEFAKQDLKQAVREQVGKKPHVNMQAAVKLQLQRAGVAHIDINELCTFRDQADFYSHRRDKGITGRMAAVIAARELRH